MGKKNLSEIAFYLSILSVILAIVGALGLDLWLASTQWMIVGVVLAVWSLYLRDQEKGSPK